VWDGVNQQLALIYLAGGSMKGLGSQSMNTNITVYDVTIQSIGKKNFSVHLFIISN
jgi:hypothetical protein